MRAGNPPAAWFQNPVLDEPTPITVTDDGRVYGHAALWGTCHVGIPGGCVTPPRTQDGYASFMLGARRVKEGHDVAVGSVTLDTVHAGLQLTAAQTKRHYEKTGAVAADVACGEDQWGIWFAGATRRTVTAAQTDELRGAKISGDWRDAGGHLELVGLLAVNTPGYPVPRRARLAPVAASAGRQDARVALVGANPVSASAAARKALVAGLAAYDEHMTQGQVADLMARVKVPLLLARARG